MEKRLREASFITFVLIAAFLLIALVSYSSADPSWSYTGESLAIGNRGGKLGAWLADISLYFFGIFAYLFPITFALLAFNLLQDQIKFVDPLLYLLKFIGLSFAIGGGCGLATMHLPALAKLLLTSAGGVCGLMLTQALAPFLSEVGSTLAFLAAFLTGMTIATGLSWLSLSKWLGSKTVSLLKCAYCGLIFFGRNFLRLQKKLLVAIKTSYKIIASLRLPVGHVAMQKLKQLVSGFKVNRIEAATAAESNFVNTSINQNKLAEAKSKLSAEPAVTAKKIKSNVTSLKAYKKIVKQKETKKAQPKFFINNEKLPSVTLLEKPDSVGRQNFSDAVLQTMAVDVEKKLQDFGIEAKVVGVYPGPVITRLELELAPGIKASKVSGLAKDLARSLLVSSVRVVEVIPGKSYVGLEIPNNHREIVHFRDLVESKNYQQSISPLSLVLGKDISGLPVVAYLEKMPHLLVAGTTGSGKSVGINAILLSILFKATPDQVKLILIDPKMLELSVYEGIPHLLAPVVTDMKDAANALRWCVAEMEQRYQLMAAVGVRNLVGYNTKVEAMAAKGEPLIDPLWTGDEAEEPPLLEKLPYIVVIIDEFADMIMVVGKKVEELIARIAQKARAAGIHMILATQRPSVDVITGLIKANVPTRISFQVSSRIDSRTILDQQGAEQLLGAGDMLYLPPGSGIPTRVHGAYVSDQEVHAVVKSLKEIGPVPEYIDTIGGGTGFNLASLDVDFDAEEDELYDEAVFIVTESRKASISNLQRRLKIGYNRAARLVEQMEATGVVSAMQPNGMREVLAPSRVQD